MKIISVSVATPQIVEFGGRRVQTSIFKTPVTGKVPVRFLNIEGDQQSDLTVHGGRDKAIYVYSSDYYEDWSAELGVQPLQVSQFGENLTVAGCTDSEVLIGIRYRIGNVEATVTQPRIPCFKLGIRLNDKTFPATFWARGRLGFYLRVDKEGTLGAGDSLEIIEQPKHKFTVRRLYETVTGGSPGDAMAAMESLPHLDDGWLRRLNRIVKNRG